LRGFVSPEQNFGGLYKVSDNIRRDEAVKEQEQRRLQAGKAASSKFLVDYLDQEQFLTGTPQDPYTVKKVSDLLKEGSSLIEQGVDNNQLLMALSPKVGRLSQETQVLKQLDAQKKKAGEMLKANPAIDINKLNNAFDEIYFETDETGNRRIKDISKLDPSKDYITEIMNTKPIYTPAGFDAYVGKAGTVTERQGMTIKDARGALNKKDMELAAPEFMIPEVNDKGEFTRQFVPKYEVAINEAKPIVSKFMDEEGREVDAEVRLLDRNTFANLPKEAMAYVLQEARQFSTENGIPPNDPRTEMFARALAYDTLKNSAKQKTSAKEIVVQQAPPAPRVSVTVNNKTDKAEVAYNDMYSVIDDYVSSTTKSDGVGAAFTGLPLDAQNVVMEFINKGKGETTKKTEADIYLRKEGGKLFIMDASKMPKQGQRPPSDAYLGELPRGATNVKTTQGVKGKVAAEQAGKGGTKPATPAATTKKKKLY
jgi:hypothetical protein